MIPLANDRQLAYTLIRLALGLNIFFHGVVRFGDRYRPFVNGTVDAFKSAPIPGFLVAGFASLLPLVEFVIGFMLILGLKTRWAALAGGIKMMFLISGMVLLQEWEVVGIQMIYVFTYAAVLAFRELDFYSVDQKFWRRHT